MILMKVLDGGEERERERERERENTSTGRVGRSHYIIVIILKKSQQ
jgi:hypothetical protein